MIFHEAPAPRPPRWNGKFIMEVNHEYSRICSTTASSGNPFKYASSAATYGGRNDNFIEDPRFEQPLNVYGYSKQLFDQYVRRWMPEINSQVVGLRVLQRLWSPQAAQGIHGVRGLPSIPR